jgi:DNA-directed RNA polymerase specialized sigma24 family protein
VHKITGYNWQQIAKVLSTYGIVANDTHEIILNLYDRGKNAKEISEITGYAETTVHAYLPRVRPAYNENISENAKRIKKYRQNK